MHDCVEDELACKCNRINSSVCAEAVGSRYLNAGGVHRSDPRQSVLDLL